MQKWATVSRFLNSNPCLLVWSTTELPMISSWPILKHQWRFISSPKNCVQDIFFRRDLLMWGRNPRLLFTFMWRRRNWFQRPKTSFFWTKKKFFFGFHFRIGGGRPILCPAFGISFTKLQINSNQLGLRSSSSWSKQTIFGEKRKKDRKAKVKIKAFESRKKKVD